MDERTTLAKVQDLIASLNAAVKAKNAERIAKTKTELDAMLKILNQEEKTDAFLAMLEAEFPVKTAIETAMIDLTGIEQDKETGVFSESTKKEIIDLEEFFKAVDGETTKPLFHNGQWMFWVEGLNHAVYENVCNRMKIADEQRSDKLKAFKISETAKTLNVASLVSKNGFTKALQAVMDAIFYAETTNQAGEPVNSYKVDTRHSEAFVLNYTRGFSKKTIGAIPMPTKKTFRQNLMHILNRVVTGNGFTAE